MEAGPLPAVSDTDIEAIDNDSLFINWTSSGLCIDYYTVTINSNNIHTESRTTNNTNIAVDNLIIDTNYSYIIIPINTIAREGPFVSYINVLFCFHCFFLES